MKQDQFLQVIDRDEAERRFRAVLNVQTLEGEEIALGEALHRVLARDVVAPGDVPGFDRANVDGFAVRAEDTFGASEDVPARLRSTKEILTPGRMPTRMVQAGEATPLATGAVMPRGADAVVMVEYTDSEGKEIIVNRPVTPGANVTWAGTDIGRGETVLRAGDLLTSRETGVLAALGIDRVWVVRKPRVAIVSTGNELIAPGDVMKPGLIFDSNATILADAVRELGGEPVSLGIIRDDAQALAEVLQKGLEYDAVLLSGGTSKGEGDLSYRVVAELGEPGIVAHGIALKPGKPLCLAAITVGQRMVPVVILPGFPTSAIFTFHEFVAPILLAMAGRAAEPSKVMQARLPLRVNSERGRTEYLLVGLVQVEAGEKEPGLMAFPMGKGSGSVTTFSRADGFLIIPRQQEYVEAGSIVQVHLLAKEWRPADIVIMGSHCLGLDLLLGKLQEQGYRSKFLAVGSTGGLEAARRGECDLAGIHLMDPQSGEYNRPFVGPDLVLLQGYKRLQGLVYRPGDARFEGKTLTEGLKEALADPNSVMINRNRGSGTRILIDQLLGKARPAGYAVEARSHNAVVAAVAQGRADWGLAISWVAQQAGLGFHPLQEEHFDFVVPAERLNRPALQTFRGFLQNPAVKMDLQRMGFRC